MNKEKLIKDYLNEPVKVGDSVTIKGFGIQENDRWGNNTAVEEVCEDGVYYREWGQLKLAKHGDFKKYAGAIGYNPFPERRDTLKTLHFGLDSILAKLGANPDYKPTEYTIGGVKTKRATFNPYVYENGTKVYYQRERCWTLEQKQALLDSIFNSVGCGLVVVRRRGWPELETMAANGETELAFHDIVDGKQRLSTIVDFVHNKFPTSDGVYWRDFSDHAQAQFENSKMISYAELPENTTDEEVLYQFLKVNHAGVPQSKAHIEFVKGLFDKITK